MATTGIYTGRGIATQLPIDSGKAMGRLSDFIVKAEEIKYNTFRQNEQEFLKNSNIDPAFFISTANQQTQVKLLNEFNQKWSQKMKDYNNNMPLEEKQQMLADKNVIIAQQQDMTTQEKMWSEHRALVNQYSTRYDRNKFAVSTANLIKTGTYRDVTPPLRSSDFSLFLKSQSQKLNKEKIAYGEPAKDQFGRIIDKYANIGEENIPSFIESNMFVDDNAYQGMTEEFLADNSGRKWNLMRDVNNDGRITNEDMDENAVVAWAKTNPKYIEAVRQIDAGTPRNPVPTKSPTAFNWNIGIGAGNNQNYLFEESKNIKLGKLTFDQYYNLGSKNYTPAPQQIQDFILIETGERISDFNKQAIFKVVGYSPDKDMLIVEIQNDVIDETGQSPNKNLWKGTLIGLDASQYNKLLENKPFGFSREAVGVTTIPPLLKRPEGSGVKWVVPKSMPKK